MNTKIEATGDAAPLERGRRHVWGAPVTVLDGPRGCEQTERTCTHVLCSMVKVTVHPPHGQPWREWRAVGMPQVALSTTPPCLDRVVRTPAS